MLKIFIDGQGCAESQQFHDQFVTFFLDFLMIQGEIDIPASHMGPWFMGYQEFRHPVANEHDIVPVFAQKLYKFH
jgi:hypothetical protein